MTPSGVRNSCETIDTKLLFNSLNSFILKGDAAQGMELTFASLMARAGIADRIAERVLGHAINGVEGTYNRHQYREEKAHALKALASLIENILRPAGAMVRRLRS